MNLNATEARKKLYGLIDEVNETHEPILISGKRGSAYLISEEDFEAIQETLYIASIPGMTESLIKASKDPLSSYSKKLNW